MSGILGLYAPGQTRSSLNATLQEMQDTLRHRGLHGSGLWVDGDIGIGHQLFATTPESQFESSPEIDQNGYVITADVRLDNRVDLIKQLGLEQDPQTQLTDPQLILAAYQLWGSECPHYLLGAFSFLIWDPVKQVLFGARDHLGVKPFYYFQNDHYCAVASEIKALLRSPQVSVNLDTLRIVDLLTSQLKDPVRTSFEGIFRLPAAHWLEYETTGAFRIHRYWQLDPNHTLDLGNDEAYATAFRDILMEAVKCRLRHSVPIGTHLSGGMDSSSVTATAELISSPSPIKTFSATFASIPDCDETEFIEAVLRTGHFESHFIPADTSGPLTHWNKLFDILDEPALGNGYLSWLMNLKAHQEGVQIILNGYDGDTTIGHGALYPHELARSGQWEAALEESKLLVQRLQPQGVSPLGLMRRTAREVLNELAQAKQWGKILEGIVNVHKPLALSRLKLTHEYLVMPWMKGVLAHFKILFPSNTSTLRPEESNFSRLSAHLLAQYRLQIQQHQAQFLPQERPNLTVRQQQWETISSGLMTFPMELLDQLSAALQIEPRYPLMDKRLVEFCLALPAHQKLYQGWSRYILRRSMEGILPPKVQWRGAKTNLSNAFHSGLRKYDQKILDDIFNSDLEHLSAFIDTETLQEKYRQVQQAPHKITELWPEITLDLWMRKQQTKSSQHEH